MRGLDKTNALEERNYRELNQDTLSNTIQILSWLLCIARSFIVSLSSTSLFEELAAFLVCVCLVHALISLPQSLFFSFNASAETVGKRQKTNDGSAFRLPWL